MKELREEDRKSKKNGSKSNRGGALKRPPGEVQKQMAAEKLMREQERRELHHLVTSSVPSPPFNGLSILNPATLSVFASAHAHLFASYAAANPDARFQIPIPLSIVSNSGQQIYQTQPSTPPQRDIINWVTDQKDKSKKKTRGSQWDKSNSVDNISAVSNRKKEKLGENGSFNCGSIMSENPVKIQNLNNNNNHDNLNKDQSNQAPRDKQFTCQVCNRGFGYKHVLQNHQRTHTGEKPFECTICQKKFTRDHHLKTHMRLHTGEKPYQCPHCDRQFVQVANLRRHLRVHTGEKPYACDLCKNKFSDSNQLKAHMLIHKGEKPYGCPTCEGRFRRRHHLMHHKCLKDTGSPPDRSKRERKSRETRRIIRMDTVSTGTDDGEMGFLPDVPEQTHPEDLSTHSLNFSSSHSSCSVSSPSPPSGESHGSVGLYSVGSSEGAEYSTDDDEIGSEDNATKTESDDASPTTF